VEAADHGKPVRSATALIRIILTPPQPPITQPPPPTAQPSSTQQTPTPKSEPLLTAAGTVPTINPAPPPEQLQTAADAKKQQLEPSPPGPAEQPRSQSNPSSSSGNSPATATSPKTTAVASSSSSSSPATENRTRDAIFKKEVYSVEVTENVDTPLVVLALGREVVAGGGAAGATFRLVGTNYGLFHVGETTGDLVLTASPDREERDTYVLRIKVSTHKNYVVKNLYRSMVFPFTVARFYLRSTMDADVFRCRGIVNKRVKSL
jgi:hypothetical protein